MECRDTRVGLVFRLACDAEQRNRGNGYLDAPELKRLTLGLLGALLLHVLIFSVMSAPGKLRPSLRPPLLLNWTSPPPKAVKVPDARPSEDLHTRGARASPPRPPASPRPLAIVDNKAIAPAAASSPPPSVPAAELLESAHATARSLAREQERSLTTSGKLGERPILPELERALGKRIAGETRLANGLVKITTASGTSYCLQPPPESARGGPAPMLAVPTNCP